MKGWPPHRTHSSVKQLHPCPCTRSRMRVIRPLLRSKIPTRFCSTRPPSPSSQPNAPGSAGPLEGFRILDMSRILAGPFGTMLLGDMGADVIKIERPGAGDDTRHWGPPFLKGESSYFLAVNRNKRSVAVDLKKEEGVQVIRDLVSSCDAVIENFPSGTAKRLGVSYEDLKGFNSRGIVYVSITGYGQDGPHYKRHGYDVMASASGGFMGITGVPNGEPVKTGGYLTGIQAGVAVTDMATGLFATSGLLAALLYRERNGVGQWITTSLYEAQSLSVQVALLANAGQDFHLTGMQPPRRGTAHGSIVPYQAFKTSSGYIIAGALNDSQWVSMCKAMEIDELADDERFSTNPCRVHNREILLDTLGDVFMRKSTAEWVTALESVSVPCAPINTLEDTFNDPQLLHLKMKRKVKHKIAGEFNMTGIPLKFSVSEADIRTPPPVLAEHTEEVLRDVAHYSDEQIAALARNGVIGLEEKV